MKKEVIKNLFGIIIGISAGLLLTLKFWGNDWWQIVTSMAVGVIVGLIIANLEKVPQAFIATKLFLVTLSFKKEDDPFRYKRKIILNAEQKSIFSAVVFIIINFILFFSLFLFISMSFLFIFIEICIGIFFCGICLAGLHKNLEFVPVPIISFLWHNKEKQFTLEQEIKFLEARNNKRLSIFSITWRLTLTMYAAFTVLFLRASVNVALKIFLILLFLLTIPFFLVREIAYSSYYLLSTASIVLGIFIGTEYISFWLGIGSGTTFFIVGLLAEKIIKVNLFSFITEDIYKKLKLKTFDY